MKKATMVFEGVKFLPRAKRLTEVEPFESQNYEVQTVIQWKEGEATRGGKTHQRNGGIAIVKLDEGQTISVFVSDLIQAQNKIKKAKFIKNLTGDDDKGYNGEVLTKGTMSFVGGELGI